ncbi:MAG: tetratricopeptide repeat protein [Bacteroidia bacterium]
MKRAVLLFFIVLNSVFINAQDASQYFNLGNEFYQKTEYDSAFYYYQRILEQGKVSPALYYNLGNTYYKKGLLGEAILYYEKASLLAPDDPEINQNLEIARARTVDKIDPLPQMFYKRWISDLKNLFAPDTWSIIAVALLWLFFGSLAVYLLSRQTGMRKSFFALAIVFLIFFITSAVVAYDRYENLTGGNSAIIFTQSVYVKSSPEEKSTNLFMLHEGTKVEVMDELSNWRKIRIANGNIGWIKEDDLKVI